MQIEQEDRLVINRFTPRESVRSSHPAATPDGVTLRSLMPDYPNLTSRPSTNGFAVVTAAASCWNHRYAADQLGDIVFTLPEVGDTVSAGDACSESTRVSPTSSVLCPG